MRFTQTLRRSKDIYECYNLGDVFLKKNENEELPGDRKKTIHLENGHKIRNF